MERCHGSERPQSDGQSPTNFKVLSSRSAVWLSGNFCSLGMGINSIVLLLVSWTGLRTMPPATLCYWVRGCCCRQLQVAISGGPDNITETYVEYLGSWYKERLTDFPIFDLHLLYRCLKEVSSSVFGSLSPFSMNKFSVSCLEGAEHRNWMMSRSSLCRPIITTELQRPSLINVVANIVGHWPLITSHFEETCKNTDGESFLV